MTTLWVLFIQSNKSQSFYRLKPTETSEQLRSISLVWNNTAALTWHIKPSPAVPAPRFAPPPSPPVQTQTRPVSRFPASQLSINVHLSEPHLLVWAPPLWALVLDADRLDLIRFNSISHVWLQEGRRARHQHLTWTWAELLQLRV